MSFDLIGPHYDWLEFVTGGRSLQHARTVCLDQLSGTKQILSAGEGHGRFAAACATRNPHAHITCIEPSDAMWRLATCRFARAGIAPDRITRLSLELPSSTIPHAQFDAIVTCFFLDCFSPGLLQEVISVLAGAARRDALWLNVDFSIPERPLLRWRAKAIHALMYSFFRVVTDIPARRLTPPDTFLEQANFQLAHRHEFEWSLLRADCWKRDSPA